MTIPRTSRVAMISTICSLVACQDVLCTVVKGKDKLQLASEMAMPILFLPTSIAIMRVEGATKDRNSSGFIKIGSLLQSLFTIMVLSYNRLFTINLLYTLQYSIEYSIEYLSVNYRF